MSELRSIRFGDIGFFVFKHDDRHFHCAVGLIVPESSMAFVLYSFVYHESFKVRMFRWELESKVHEAEDEAFREEVDRLRRGES